MLWVYSHFKNFLFQNWYGLYALESDVYWRQILMYKVGPRTEKDKVYDQLLAVWFHRRGFALHVRMSKKTCTLIVFQIKKHNGDNKNPYSA